MLLYKYRGNSAFTDKIFISQKVWLSTANGLNDPFECSIQEIAKDWIEDKIKQYKVEQLNGFIAYATNCLNNKKNFFNLTPGQTKELLNVFKKEIKFNEKYKKYRKSIKDQTGHYPTDLNATFSAFDEQLNEVGIFSLTEEAENQLMWSHYGQQSKGIAIGFLVEENSKLADPNYCFKVNYSDELPKFTGDGIITETGFYFDSLNRPYAKQKISFSDPTFKAAISTKATCWNYEREWRYVEEKSGEYNLPGPIREVMFGLNCTSEIRQHYKNLIEKYIFNPVSLFEIKKAPNSNSFTKVHIEDLRK